MNPRTKPLTKMETILAVNVPTEERRKTLTELKEDVRPDQDTIAAVVPILNDPDENMRQMAETVLVAWGAKAVSALLYALRSTEPLDIPYRLALIRQLERMGPVALRAETLLRSYADDPNVGEAATQAVKTIRGDGQDLASRFTDWGIELALLALTVGLPMAAMRIAAPKQILPPLGIIIGIGSLAVFGLMLARYVYAGDLLPDRESDQIVSTKRRMNYLLVGIIGTVMGVALTGAMCACGAMIPRILGK